MLFAESDMNIYMVVMSVITTFGALGTAAINAKLSIEKMRLDGDVASMKDQIAGLQAANDERKAETATCHEERDRDRVAHQRQIEELWRMFGDRRREDTGPPPGRDDRRTGP